MGSEILGEILDLVEIAATPALIEGCVKGIEKEGKAEFKVFGKKHTLSLGEHCHFMEKMNYADGFEYPDEPSKLPETRPPKSSHDPEPTSSACDKRAGNCQREAPPITEARQPIPTERMFCCFVFEITSESNVTTDPGIMRICDGAQWPQACQHYSSVIDYHQPLLDPEERGYNPLTCPTSSRGNYRAGGQGEQITVDWSDQHNDGW